MAWIVEHWFILLLIVGYLAILIRHAASARRQTRGVSDYYVGGRKMGGLALGLSFFATYSSTNSFVGFAGQGYTYGLSWLLLVPAVVFFSALAWLLIAPRLRLFTELLESLTVPDFFGFRFDSVGVRLQAAVLVLFASLLYMTAIFKGIGNTLEAFLQIPYWVAVLIVFLIVMLYTSVGGFLSVVRTDVVQGVMLVLAAVVLSAGTIRASGGIGSFFDVAQTPQGSELFSWNAALPLPVLLGVIFAATIKFLVEPRQLSRFYALKDRGAARTGMWVSTLSFLVVYSLLIPVGIYARNIFPTGLEDTDRVVPSLLVDPAIFHPILSAFIVLALIAAAMSSLDSVLLVTASIFQRDIMEVWRGRVSDRKAVRNTAIYVALFALVTTGLALNPPGEIVPLTAFSGSLYAACFFPGLVFGLYWKRGNSRAISASFAAGLLTLLSWDWIGAFPRVHEVFPSLFLSTTAYLVVAWFSVPARPETIDRLFSAAN